MSEQRTRCPCCGQFRKTKTKDERIKIVDVVEIPNPRWDGLFSSIQEGKALVIPNEVMCYNSVFAALKIRHKKGKFLHLKTHAQTGPKGEKNTYIIYENEQKTQTGFGGHQLKLIKAIDVPESLHDFWSKVFTKIPAGKAGVLLRQEQNYRQIYGVLNHIQKSEDKFQNHQVRVVDDKIYIIHHTHKVT